MSNFEEISQCPHCLLRVFIILLSSLWSLLRLLLWARIEGRWFMLHVLVWLKQCSMATILAQPSLLAEVMLQAHREPSFYGSIYLKRGGVHTLVKIMEAPSIFGFTLYTVKKLLFEYWHDCYKYHTLNWSNSLINFCNLLKLEMFPQF